MRHLVAAAFLPRSRYISRSNMGMMNAAVFPDPVTAFPTTSLPNSATGIVAAWIGVGAWNPSEVIDLMIGLERFIERKDVCSSEIPTSASDAKNAAFRSFSACVSSSESSEDEEAPSPSSSSWSSLSNPSLKSSLRSIGLSSSSSVARGSSSSPLPKPTKFSSPSSCDDSSSSSSPSSASSSPSSSFSSSSSSLSSSSSGRFLLFE